VTFVKYGEVLSFAVAALGRTHWALGDDHPTPQLHVFELGDV
jgi:hypothetical protein